MRLRTRLPNQPITWIPAVLDAFKLQGRLTSLELAQLLGKSSGGDSVARCRQLGLPVQDAGFANGSRLPRKLYALDLPLLWLALEEAVKQIDRYALILNSREGTADCRTFRKPAMWIEHVDAINNHKPKTSSANKTNGKPEHSRLRKTGRAITKD